PEDHRHAVHREDLVVGLRREQVNARPDQLHAHQHRFDSADAQQDHAGDQEADADALVIDGTEPADESPRTAPDLLQTIGERGRGGRIVAACIRGWVRGCRFYWDRWLRSGHEGAAREMRIPWWRVKAGDPRMDNSRRRRSRMIRCAAWERACD